LVEPDVAEGAGMSNIYIRATGPLHLGDQSVVSDFRFALVRESLLFLTHADTQFTLGGGNGLTKYGSDPIEEAATGHSSESYRLDPGEELAFKAALALHAPNLVVGPMDRIIKNVDPLPALITQPERLPADPTDPLGDHIAAYQSWFDRNLAYFDCSDPWVRKM